MKKLIAMVMLGTTLTPALGQADWGHDRNDRRDRNDRHDRSDRRDRNDRWRPVHREVHRRGAWQHGYHNGHLGWWFVLAGAWYAVNRAAYEAQAEPVIIEQPAPAPAATMSSPYWYYCRSTNSYFPYVSGCTEGWQQVAAQPSMQ